MIKVLFLAFLSVVFSQLETAICDFESYLDLGFNEQLLDQARLPTNPELRVILSSENIFLIDLNQSVLNSTSTPNSGSYQCYKIVAHVTENIFFVLCGNENVSPYLAAYKYENTSLYLFGNYSYLSLTNGTVNKVKLMYNSLLVQQSNSITFYTLVLQAASWYVRTTSYTIDQQFLNVTSVNFTDFDIASYYYDSSVNVIFLIADYTQGVFYTNAVLRSNTLIPYNYGLLPLKSSYYIPYNSLFRNVGIVSQPNSTFTNFVVSVVNDNTYQFHVVLSSSYLYLYYQTQLSQYKDWTQVGDIVSYDNVVALSYQNYQKTIVTELFDLSSTSLYSRKEVQENQIQNAPNDLLISASIDKLILYFTSNRTIVYLSDVDALTSCTLSNYKLE